MKKHLKYHTLLFLMILTLPLLSSCRQNENSESPLKIKVDHLKILKAYYGESFSNIDNTDDIEHNIFVIDQVKEGLDKYSFPERNSFLKHLEKGELEKLQSEITRVSKSIGIDKRLASQLLFLSSRLYRMEHDKTGEDVEEKIDAANAKARELFPDNPDLNEHIGNSLNTINETEGAIEYFQKALTFIESHEADNPLYKRQQIRLYRTLGATYSIINEHENALKSLEKGIELAQQYLDKDDILIAKLYKEIAVLYYQTNEIKSALENIILAQNIIEKNRNNNSFVCDIYNTLAAIYNKQNDHRAKDYYIKSIDATKYYYGTVSKELIETNVNFAYYYKKQNDYSAALKLYTKNISMIDTNYVRLKYYLPKQLYYIAESYFDLKQYTNALEYYNKAIEQKIKHDTVSSEEMIDILIGKALTLQELEEYEEAKWNYNKTLELSSKIYTPESYKIGGLYNHIGLFYDFIEETEKALDYYHQAISIYKKNNMQSSFQLAAVYYNTASSHYYLSQYKEAQKYMTLSYDIYNEIYGPDHPETKSAKEGMETIAEEL